MSLQNNLTKLLSLILPLFVLMGCQAQKTQPADTSKAPSTSSSNANQSSQAVTNKQDKHTVTITLNGKPFEATLNHTTTAEAVINQLPLSIQVQGLDSGFDEHTADLSANLPTTGTPAGADPKPGQIAYWSPQPRIVLYWGDVSYYNGIHIIGQFNQADKATAYLHSLKYAYQMTIKEEKK